jgi:hypothetical protein
MDGVFSTVMNTVLAWTEAITNCVAGDPCAHSVQTYANIATAVIALAALVFGGWQILLVNRNIRSSTHERITTESFAILKFLSEVPGIYDYFYSQKPPPNETNEPLRYATEMVSNYLEHVLLQKRYLPRKVRKNWHSYVKEICRTAPIVRAHVKEYNAQYSKILLRAIIDVEKEEEEKNKSSS